MKIIAQHYRVLALTVRRGGLSSTVDLKAQQVMMFADDQHEALLISTNPAYPLLIEYFELPKGAVEVERIEYAVTVELSVPIKAGVNMTDHLRQDFRHTFKSLPVIAGDRLASNNGKLWTTRLLVEMFPGAIAFGKARGLQFCC